MCDCIFEFVDNVAVPVVWRNISLILRSNSEAFASELLQNIEEMFPRYLVSGSWTNDHNILL